MTSLPESIIALAETLSPLARELTAGLLLRPAPVPGDEPPDLVLFFRKGDDLLRTAHAALSKALASFEGCEPDELDELADDLAGPAFELVDLAREIWEIPLPLQCEGARPLLATLAEAPVAELIAWIQRIMHAVIDPWAVLEEPERPTLEYVLDVRDEPVRELLKLWQKAHPGVLPEGIFL